MKKSILAYLVISGSLLLSISCQKKLDSTPLVTPAPPAATTTKIAPEGFTYHTDKTVSVNVTALTNNSQPLPFVPVNLYTLSQDGQLGKLVLRGFTNASGLFSATVTVPAYFDTLVVDPAYVGLLRYAKVPVNGTQLTCTIGGPSGMSSNITGTVPATNAEMAVIQKTIDNQQAMMRYRTNDINGIKTNTKFIEMGGYDNQGLPNYMEKTRDIISQEMLASINASLPEQKQVPTVHPEYISSGTNSNIVIVKKAEVWITFVHEGAGYRNTFGYYKYKTGNEPATVNDIDSIFYVIPNCSLAGSGGSMVSGDKIKLGVFEPGTTIGLVVFANGWNGSINTAYSPAFFSNENLNPETDAKLKKHNVLLQYKDTYLIGFEDINRQSTACDQDFNDLILYATANPIEAISTLNVKQAAVPKDSDGDGTPDTFDAFPADAAKAYINYYPAQDVFGTLAFEDLWPYKGDYDLNDLVVKYNYSIISNSMNQAIEMTAEFLPVASGATYKNGFGIDLGIANSQVKSVNGYKHSRNYIKLNSNGTEAQQDNAVIVPFDDAQNLLLDAGGNFSMNTFMEQANVKASPIRMNIVFNSGVSTNGNISNSLVLGNLNPFLISNMNRGAEVHLPGFKPTKLADLALLGQGNDATNTAKGIYYVNKDNYPWALNFTESFLYPTEGTAINNAYLHFFEWAASGGAIFKDWYNNPNYRNNSLVYTK